MMIGGLEDGELAKAKANEIEDRFDKDKEKKKLEEGLKIIRQLKQEFVNE